MSNIALTIEEINKLNPLEIVTNEVVRQRFTDIYETLWGNGEAAYTRESFYFNQILADNEKMQKATKFSIFIAFIDLAVSGVSLEPGTRAQAYLQGRNFCIGTDANGKKLYEGRLTLTISGYGELFMRERAGQILHADNPVLVYEEDEFSFKDVDGHKSVTYRCSYPHTSAHIIAAYLRITRIDGSVDYFVMFEEDWNRLKSFSEKSNRRWDNNIKNYVGEANALYTSNNGSIDPGFLAAKCIKHAFKSYPKVRIGKNAMMESDIDSHQAEIDGFYNVDGAPQDNKPEQQTDVFGNKPDYSAGVTVDPATTATEDDGTF